MTKKSSMKVPDSFKKFLDGHERKSKVISGKKKQQKRKKAAKERRQKEKSKKEEKSSLKYAEAIFQWGEKFRDSKAGKRAIAAVPAHYRPDKSLVFFEWRPGWGYHLSITNEGIEWYRFGPGSVTKLCRAPEELARTAASDTPGMLKAACDAIESGEFWESIKKDLECFIRFAEED